jgi:hypothetical protein
MDLLEEFEDKKTLIWTLILEFGGIFQLGFYYLDRF